MSRFTSCPSTSQQNSVTRTRALTPREAARSFETRLQLETDCSDVHATQHLEDRGFVLLDARSASLYAAGHLPGAISLPHAQIDEGTLAKFSRESLFVVYCAGPHCNGAQKAALKIAQLGYAVKEMMGGIAGWKHEGFDLVGRPESTLYPPHPFRQNRQWESPPRTSDMSFNLEATRSALARTPQVLTAWLKDLPGQWVHHREGEDRWSPFDVVGHLVHGELTDWIPRAHIILDVGPDRTFVPFDRFAQDQTKDTETLSERLQQFETCRGQSLAALDAMKLSSHHLGLEGTHPEFGRVTLQQLLAAWVAHDFSHVAQIARIMAHAYAEEVGPWAKYLRIIDEGRDNSSRTPPPD